MGEIMERKIRILYVAPALKIGGMERQLLTLINNLDKNKYEIHLALFRGDIEYEIPAEVNIVYLNKKAKIDIFFLLRFAKCIIDIKPHIIQSCISGVNFYTYIIGTLLGYSNIILSIRSTKLFDEYKFLKRMNKLKKIRNVIANSFQAKKELIEHALLDENVVNVIHNGIDIKRFKSINIPLNNLSFSITAQELLKEKRFIIGVFGRILLQKNHKVIIDALAYLKNINSLPEDLGVVFMGPISQNDVLKYYMDMIKENNLENFIVIEDKKDDIENYYNFIDVLCLPSFYEGFSNVILEAMACEKPIIISAGANNDELIKHGENGWVFKKQDYERLGEIILEAYHMDEERLVEIKKRNRKIIEEHFSVDNLVRKTESIYDRMLEITHL